MLMLFSPRRLEHGGGDARIGEHARTDDRNFGKIVLGSDLFCAYGLAEFFGDLHRFVFVGGGYGKADVLGAVAADRLQDDVDIDLAGRQRGEQLKGNARTVRNLNDRNSNNVVVHRDALNQHFFHFANLLDFGARHIAVDARAYFQFYRIFFGHLHRPVVQDVGAAGGQLQHLVVGDLVQLVRVRHNAWVGGVDAVHVGVNFTFVRLHRRCNGHPRWCRCRRGRGW